MYPAMKIIVLVISNEVIPVCIYNIPVCIYNNIHNFMFFIILWIVISLFLIYAVI